MRPPRWRLILSVAAAFCFAILSSVALAAPPAQQPKAQSPAPKASPAQASQASATTQPGSAATKPGSAAAKPGSNPAKPAAKKSASPRLRQSKAGGASSGGRQSELYGDRLDGLQVEVDALKDKIFRSKARLNLLKETVLRGVLAGSRITVAHRNLMGSMYRLVRMEVLLDGAQIYSKTDETGGMDSEDEVIIYDGNMPPGPHNLSVVFTYKGRGYGVFSYLNDMTFTSSSAHDFTAPENGALKVTAVGYERGNITTEMNDKPNVQWQEVPLDATGRPLPSSRKRRSRAQGQAAKKSP